MDATYEDIAGMIDHSLLAPTLTRDELEAGLRVARAYRVASVCILPYYVRRCAEALADTGVVASTTIGFPHGGHTTSTKVAEARQAVDDGALELDMVVNISAVRSADYELVRSDIAAVCDVTHARGARLKVIFENCHLSDAQKIELCRICGTVGVDWVKTSTGYGPSGATDADLALMRAHSPAHVQVKAAHGIRTLDRLLEVRALGVSRAGSTATAAILDECRHRLSLPPIKLA
jgi:deoxyribose-phosphate aldolase